MLFSDQHLAQRLEQTEAQANANFIDARHRLNPDSPATWTKVAGVYALFDGVESPLTQTFGLGLFDKVEAAELMQLEHFFAQHGAPVLHEVSPMADPGLLAMLPTRGYHPLEYTSVLYRELTPEQFPAPEPHAQLRTRRIGTGEIALWSRTSAEGWSTEGSGLNDFMLAYGQISGHSAGVEPFLAEANGYPIAAGAVFMHEGVALLMGASTVPDGRRQGAQSALLAARLSHAAHQGCTLATMGALPGSQSQRNAEKNGFRIAYTRIKWQLMRP